MESSLKDNKEARVQTSTSTVADLASPHPFTRVAGVFNPSSASGRARRLIKAWSKSAGALDVDWVESRSAEHLQELVRAAQAPSDEPPLDALLLAGGDGTVTLAAEALRGVEQRVPLAILPAGSGNDFARDLGIVGAAATPAGLLACGRPRWVDLAEVHTAGSGSAGARFGCVASVGFDARALELIHGAWLPRSKLLNVWASLRALWSVPPAEVRVRWDAGEYEGRAMLVGVTNTRGYGGGFLLSPNARLDDGLLDLCLIGDIGRGRLVREFPRIFAGTHGERPGVLLAQSPWVTIESLGSLEAPLPVCLDGERPLHTAPVELRALSQALWVIAPGVRP